MDDKKRTNENELFPEHLLVRTLRDTFNFVTVVVLYYVISAKNTWTPKNAYRVKIGHLKVENGLLLFSFFLAHKMQIMLQQRLRMKTSTENLLKFTFECVKLVKCDISLSHLSKPKFW